MSNRALVLMGAFGVGLLWVALLTLVLPDGVAVDLLLDRNTRSLPYPFTIQNVMWIVFFMAAGELVVRHMEGTAEADQLRLGLLPEDEETILHRKDLAGYYKRIRRTDPDGRYWMQRLLTAVILQFQSSGSAQQVSAMFNSSMELYQHETELRYNTLRYAVWLIPTLGFIGTVLGIAFALRSAGQLFAAVDPNLGELGPEMMTSLTAELGVAFYTTLLALLQSAVLMLALHTVQGREEGALNRVGHYCLRNLVNRLYEQRPPSAQG